MGAATSSTATVTQETVQGLTSQGPVVAYETPPLVAQLEHAESAYEVLSIAHNHLEELDHNSAVSAVYLAARHCNASSTPPGLAVSPQLQGILACLRPLMKQLRRPKLMARLLWALGKLEIRSADVQDHVAHVVRAAPPLLPQFNALELSNTLWGLARLIPSASLSSSEHHRGRRGKGGGSGGSWETPDLVAAHNLAMAITKESSRRLAERPGALSAQCLSNSLWALARLEIRGRDAEDFARRCVQTICCGEGPSPEDFSPQGLANALWATAKICSGGGGDDGKAWQFCVVVISEARPRLAEFQAQELSMLAWAVAKLRGRGAFRRTISPAAEPNTAATVACSFVAGENAGGGVATADSFLEELASEARSRLPELAPQGVSNIAWALATADLFCRSPGRHGTAVVASPAAAFVLAAAAAAGGSLANYPPQAVANLLWSVGRLPPSFAGVAGHGDCASSCDIVARLAAAAAKEATVRMAQFGWQDLAGVLVALGQGRHKSPEALNLAMMVSRRAEESAKHLTTQVLLNIALSAARLGVPKDCLQGLMHCIGGELQVRKSGMNALDMRQWAEVQRVCWEWPTSPQSSPRPSKLQSPRTPGMPRSPPSPNGGSRAGTGSGNRVRLGAGLPS